jgi:hypothetical protein
VATVGPILSLMNDATTMRVGDTVKFCGCEDVTVLGLRSGLVTTGDRGAAMAPVALVRWADGAIFEVPADTLG